MLSGLISLITFTVSAQKKPLKIYEKDGLKIPSYDYASIKDLLEKKSDTTYIVNFWATWCAPCVAELPGFESVNAKYKDQKVKVVLVSLDFTKQVEKSLLPFIQRKKLQSTVLHLSDPDANAWISKVDENWSGAIPATLIYNGAKNLRKFYERGFTEEELKSEIKQFL